MTTQHVNNTDQIESAFEAEPPVEPKETPQEGQPEGEKTEGEAKDIDYKAEYESLKAEQESFDDRVAAEVEKHRPQDIALLTQRERDALLSETREMTKRNLELQRDLYDSQGNEAKVGEIDQVIQQRERQQITEEIVREKQEADAEIREVVREMGIETDSQIGGDPRLKNMMLFYDEAIKTGNTRLFSRAVTEANKAARKHRNEEARKTVKTQEKEKRETEQRAHKDADTLNLGVGNGSPGGAAKQDWTGRSALDLLREAREEDN